MRRQDLQEISRAAHSCEMQIRQMHLGFSSAQGWRRGRKEGMAAHRALVVLEDGEVLQDVVLDCGHVGHAHPVLGGGPHKPLRAVLVLHPAHVPA